MPGPAARRAKRSSTTSYYYHDPARHRCPPGQWYAYTERSDYLQTTEFANISFDITDQLNVEAGAVHFHSDFKYYTPYSQFAYYKPGRAAPTGRLSHKWNSKFGINYKIADHAWSMRDFRRASVTAASMPATRRELLQKRRAHNYAPDTLNNYELG